MAKNLTTNVIMVLQALVGKRWCATWGLKQNDLCKSKPGMRLLIAATVAFFSAFVPVPLKADDCAMLEGVSFRFVFSYDKLRKVLSGVIKNNNINSVEGLDKLSYCYKQLGPDYETTRYEFKITSDDSDKNRIMAGIDMVGRNLVGFRFDLDQSGWIFPWLLGAGPGGNSGNYFALFRYDVDQKNIFTYRRGVDGQWLKLE
jgi:hypothetical protein